MWTTIPNVLSSWCIIYRATSLQLIGLDLLFEEGGGSRNECGILHRTRSVALQQKSEIRELATENITQCLSRSVQFSSSGREKESGRGETQPTLSLFRTADLYTAATPAVVG